MRFMESPIGFFAVHWDLEPDFAAKLVWCPAFRRPGPAKAGTPNRRFMESPIRFGACIGSKRNQPRQEPVTRTVRMLLSRGAVGPFEKLSPFGLHRWSPNA